MKLKNTKAKKSQLEWDYEPPKINGGKQTIDDMSLVAGMYENYEVSKSLKRS